MTGDKFGRWTVIHEVKERNKFNRIMWLCKCDCGTQREVSGSILRSGESKSCGCYKSYVMKEKSTTHGMTYTKIYQAWRRMISRCYNDKLHAYDRYGGRGIIVCDRWLHSFENFFEDMGEKPKGKSLDRINNDGNYEPSNCRWATQTEQMRNRNCSRTATFRGVSKTIAEWAEILKVKYDTLHGRLETWSVEKSFNTPIRYRRNPNDKI